MDSVAKRAAAGKPLHSNANSSFVRQAAIKRSAQCKLFSADLKALVLTSESFEHSPDSRMPHVSPWFSKKSLHADTNSEHISWVPPFIIFCRTGNLPALVIWKCGRDNRIKVAPQTSSPSLNSSARCLRFT